MKSTISPILILVCRAMYEAGKRGLDDKASLDIVRAALPILQNGVIEELSMFMFQMGKKHGNTAEASMAAFADVALESHDNLIPSIERFGNVCHALLGDKWDMTKVLNEYRKRRAGHDPAHHH